MTTPGSPLKVERADDVTIIGFRDRLLIDNQEIRRIEQELEDLIAARSEFKLVVDLDQVQAISSKMLGALITIHSQLLETKGDLALCNLHARVEDVFKITKLNIMFSIHENQAEAIEAIR